jgi:nitrite reductase (NAD(P)H)
MDQNGTKHRAPNVLFSTQASYLANRSLCNIRGLFRFYHITGEQVTSIDTAAHTITTSKNQLIKYDLAVLATGSNASLPPYITSARATSTAGVFVYRNLSDLDRLISYSEKDGISGGRACVIGGGLLGLEAAKAAYDLPGVKDVAIINRKSFPLSRQIDAEAGELVLQRIEALGVKVFTNCVVKDIITTPTTEGEVFSGLEFTDGTIIEAQIVIFAVGIAPREDLARASGIACHEKGGIIVNDDLKTSAEDVFAIGECASWRGQTYGLIGPGGSCSMGSSLYLKTLIMSIAPKS